MTIDERLERLVERHEALAQSVEMLFATAKEQGESIRALILTAKNDGDNIRALARIADIHERRLTALEGGEAQ